MLSGTITVNGGETLHISADNVVMWADMRDETTQLRAINATVSVWVTDSAGNAVSDVDAVTLSYVDAGMYRGVIDATDSALLTEGDVYHVHVSAVAGSADGYRVIECVARYRDEE